MLRHFSKKGKNNDNKRFLFAIINKEVKNKLKIEKKYI